MTLTREQIAEMDKLTGFTEPISKPSKTGVARFAELEQLSTTKPTLRSKLAERGQTLVSEVTAKPARDIMALSQGGTDQALAAGEALTRTAQAPIRALGAIGGAIGDVVGAGLEATGADEVIGKAVAPIVQSDPVQRATEAFKSLPPETQEVLGAILNTANIPVAGAGASLIKQGAEAGIKSASKVASGTKNVGEFVYSRAFTPNVAEAERILAYEATKPSSASKIYGAGALEGNPVFKPVTVADTALRSGIAGTEKQIGIQAKQVADNLYKKEIAPSVKGIEGVITREELFAPLAERIAQITDPSKKNAYQNAFDSLAEDYKNIDSFTFEQAQKLKSELAEFTPAKVFKGQDVANETRMLQADMAKFIREKTYDALKDKNIKQKYIDYGNLQELQKVGVRAISEAGTKGGFGGFWTTMYDTLLTPIKTIGGKTLYRVGDKLEFTAPKVFEGKSFKDYLVSIGYLAPEVIEQSTEQQ